LLRHWSSQDPVDSISTPRRGLKDVHEENGQRCSRQYAFIKAHQHKHRVQTMCRLLGVAPSGYYAWLAQPISDHPQEDAALLRLIRASFRQARAAMVHRASSSIPDGWDSERF
jgi:hypothetical protein